MSRLLKLTSQRLKEKYGFKPGEVRGTNYQKLMQEVIATNAERISRRVYSINKKHYTEQYKKLGRREKAIITPDLTDVMPKRSVYLNKAAINGDYIKDTLKDRLTRDLRASLGKFQREQIGVERRRGVLAGTMKPELVERFEESIRGTFKTYRRGQPGIPSNVATIARTEVRFNVSNMKQEYNKRFYELNKDTIEMTKEWRQNKSLSKVPRDGHSIVHGQKKPMDQYFEVPHFVKGKIAVKDSMLHPHDPKAPAYQTINCSCDLIYRAKIKAVAKK